MTANVSNDDDREARRAARIAEILAQRAAAAGDAGSDRPVDEGRSDRFVGPPPGYNEDGTRQRERTAAERKHKADILAGRKQPGSRIEDPPETD